MKITAHYIDHNRIGCPYEIRAQAEMVNKTWDHGWSEESYIIDGDGERYAFDWDFLGDMLALLAITTGKLDAKQTGLELVSLEVSE